MALAEVVNGNDLEVSKSKLGLEIELGSWRSTQAGAWIVGDGRVCGFSCLAALPKGKERRSGLDVQLG